MKTLAMAPGVRLIALTLFGLAVVSAMIGLAVSRPWLGLVLAWDAQADAARVLAGSGPSAGIPAGTLLTHVSGAGGSHRLSELDFTVEPDGNLATYAEYRRFLAGQGRLAALQSGPELAFHGFDARRFAVVPDSHRPVASLPADFWVQIAVGFFAWMIAAAVWAFRPRLASARFLLFNGWTTLMFSPGAAVYTTREFALPLGQMLVLKSMNFGGGMLFVGSMVALMLSYPRQIGTPRLGILAIAAAGAWFVVQAFGVFDSMLVGRRVPVFIALIAMFVVAAIQWLGTRRDPVARAAMQWFLLSWVVCIGLFVALIMVPQVLGVQTGSIQGYSFILFLLLYLGIAFGILRFRLFDLGIWWFRTLAWIGGAIALIALDLLFLFGMQFSASWSLSLSLLACALFWLPFRSWLWGRVMRRTPPADDLFRQVLDVALAPNPADRAYRWQALLQRLYVPLHIVPARAGRVGVEQDGVALAIPAVGPFPAWLLQYPGDGTRLFNPADVRLARQAVEMLAYADASREAYAQGAREERGRIARDLHDDIGSRLISGLYQPDLLRTRESMSMAIREMRVIIQGLIGEKHPVSVLESEMRYEAGDRLETAGIDLSWRGCDAAGAEAALIDYGVYKNTLSAVRELTTNVIRHARATAVEVRVQLDAGRLVIDMTDDGQGFDPAAAHAGRGLRNIRSRLGEMGGAVRMDGAPGRTCVRLTIPLHPSATARGEPDPERQEAPESAG